MSASHVPCAIVLVLFLVCPSHVPQYFWYSLAFYGKILSGTFCGNWYGMVAIQGYGLRMVTCDGTIVRVRLYVFHNSFSLSGTM